MNGTEAAGRGAVIYVGSWKDEQEAGIGMACPAVCVEKRERKRRSLTKPCRGKKCPVNKEIDDERRAYLMNTIITQEAWSRLVTINCQARRLLPHKE